MLSKVGSEAGGLGPFVTVVVVPVVARTGQKESVWP